jgi:hypothetical protein
MGCLYSLLLNQLNFLVSNLLYSSRAGRLTMICGGHNRVTASLSSNFQDAGMYPMIPRTALAAPTTPITPSLQGPPKMPSVFCSSNLGNQFITIKSQTQIHFIIE